MVWTHHGHISDARVARGQGKVCAERCGIASEWENGGMYREACVVSDHTVIHHIESAPFPGAGCYYKVLEFT
jgi:hypothetical protein